MHVILVRTEGPRRSAHGGVIRRIAIPAHALDGSGDARPVWPEIDIIELQHDYARRPPRIRQQARRTVRYEELGALHVHLQLVPLAHPIAITHAAADFRFDAARSEITLVATVECRGRTGVEMGALTAVAVGLLTIYDMVKAVDRGMTIGEVRLEEKRGGRSGAWRSTK